ncbi:MAG: S8 family serine peptidase, partial [Kiritimatiellae bacterium]|nr:S8 family serine peptidase [Kiritimatiellia bacterium]
DDAGGNGYNSYAIECIEYAVDQKLNHGQNVVAINASWGSTSSDTTLSDAIDAAGDQGIVFCAASGNSTTPRNLDVTPYYPAAYDLANIIAVAATDDDDVIASFSGYGATKVDLGAPGVGILSTVPGRYTPQVGDIFFDNMESGVGNWTHGGTLDSWAISENQEGFANASFPVPSPTHFWSDSPGIDYSANTDSWLAYGADIDLSSYVGQDIYLGFGSAMYIEGDGWDHGYVELSSDSGATWAPIFDFSGYAYYWGNYFWFIPESFKTSHFRFRFHITSDESYQYYGWLIDNVGIGTAITYGYESWNGTSMATPHVAGAIALLAAEYPAEGVSTRIARILANVDANTSLAGKCVTGGRLNLYNAIIATVTDAITVTSPNGGENWQQGTSQNITWNSAGTIANVRIEYSINNGSSWNDVIASTANDGSHPWTIPNTPSTTCLIRISDTANAATNDVSDATFTISAVITPTITVTSPNGAENWLAGTSQNITWASTGTIANVQIEYSINSGSTWSTINAYTANDGSYTWTIPNTPSTDCLVKVIDRSNFAVNDSSNTVFTITASISHGNWTQKSPVNSPPARNSYAMAYDAARKEVVLFGGSANLILNDTWVWNGSNWTQKSPATSPPARSMHAMAYDAAREEVVMFGGNGFRDTWVWNGSDWTQKSPASSPAANFGQCMAYDAARGEVVLFGTEAALTWIWNGSNWHPHSGGLADPDARAFGAMAYDATHGQVVLFGGGSISYYGDTWLWGGSSWTAGHPVGWVPVARGGHGLAYDANLGQVVLFGGIGGSDSGYWNDTWLWDGSNWMQELPAISPPGRTYTAMAYDAERKEVVLFGGWRYGTMNDTWVWASVNPGATITVTSPNGGESWTVGSSHDITWTSTGTIANVNIDYSTNNGSSWTSVATGTANDGSYPWTVANAPSTTCLVRVSDTSNVATNDVSDATFTISAAVTPTVTVTSPDGGESWQVGSSQNITWTSTGAIANIMIEYSINNGSNWTTETALTVNDGTYAWLVPNSPSTNCLVKVSDATNAAVTDSSNIVFAIFVSGSNWTQKSPATSPPARYSTAMAYDAARGQVVLFGGNTTGIMNDTWVWNGSNWTQKSPATNPPARSSHAMAYDAARGQVVLFGGNSSSGVLNDTWVWDGSNWTQKSPASSPPARFIHAMAYDAARGQVVLFGGNGNLNDTWIWDGSNWSQKSPLLSPPAIGGHAMTYDAARGQVVLFGGISGLSGKLNDTWVWDGSNWSQKSPASSPPARSSHAMAYDAAHEQVVLFGGNTTGIMNDTWVWDGSNWTQEFPALSPPVRSYQAMTYYAARGEVVLFGGLGASWFLNDTWVWPAVNPGNTITSPNGGESWTVGESHDITWTSTGTITNVNIDYSTDSGGSWASVAAGTSNDGTYSWTVPNTPSTTCLVRVSDAANADTLDTSDAVFTITASAAETVSTPDMPTGPSTGLISTSYDFSTGGSTSSLGHDIQYFFDWDDGSDSGWLAVGTTEASHSWAAAGTYDVRAMARCATHTTVESIWSTTLSVIITDGVTTGHYNSPAQYKVLPEVIWSAATGGGTWMSNVQVTDVSGGSQVSVYYNAASGRRGPFLLWDNSAGGALSSVKYTNLLQTIDGLDSGAFTYYG